MAIALLAHGTEVRSEHRGIDADHRSGVRPSGEWTCPLSHPIKGNFTTTSGERCIHHHPRQRYYERTKPERCYATDTEAEADGCRRAKV